VSNVEIDDQDHAIAASQLAALDDELETFAEANRHVRDPAAFRRKHAVGLLGSAGLRVELDRPGMPIAHKIPIAHSGRNDGVSLVRNRLGRLDHRWLHENGIVG
jgi:hypothetical protein